jgi:hypothetical protein
MAQVVGSACAITVPYTALAACPSPSARPYRSASGSAQGFECACMAVLLLDSIDFLFLASTAWCVAQCASVLLAA